MLSCVEPSKGPKAVRSPFGYWSTHLATTKITQLEICQTFRNKIYYVLKQWHLWWPQYQDLWPLLGRATENIGFKLSQVIEISTHKFFLTPFRYYPGLGPQSQSGDVNSLSNKIPDFTNLEHVIHPQKPQCSSTDIPCSQYSGHTLPVCDKYVLSTSMCQHNLILLRFTHVIITLNITLLGLCSMNAQMFWFYPQISYRTIPNKKFFSWLGELSRLITSLSWETIPLSTDTHKV